MHKKNKTKKAQMEILGLAFIVILISLGLLFLVVFDSGDDGSQVTDFTFKQLASNFINSIIHATALDCNHNKIEDLMRDCATGAAVVCDNGKNSCQYVNDTLETILNETLDNWVTTGYVLNISSDGVVRTEFVYKDCNTMKTGENARFPIPLDPGFMYIDLYLCK